MLLMFSVRLAATINYFLRAHAPTNIMVRRLRTRDGLKWAIPAALVLVPAYLLVAAIATNAIADGGPGWLNLVAFLFIWNAAKFAWWSVLAPLHLLGGVFRGVRRVGESPQQDPYSGRLDRPPSVT